MKRISVHFGFDGEDGTSVYIEGEDRVECILNAARFLREVFDGSYCPFGLSGLFRSYKKALDAGYKEIDWRDEPDWLHVDGNEYIGSVGRSATNGGDELLTFSVSEVNQTYTYLGDWAFEKGPRDGNDWPDLAFWAGRIERGEFYEQRYRVDGKDFATYREAHDYTDKNGGWAESYIVGVEA